MHKIVGRKLKEIRENAGMTQEEVANLIKKKKADVGHYENERATPPANALVTFLIELNVQPQEIAERTA